MADTTQPASASHATHPYRSRHRAASHASAHADPEQSRPHKVINHPLVPQGSADLIASDSGLVELIEHVRSAGSFAYDSEFIGELSYHPKLCLLQVSTTTRVALIDPLAPIDLDPFWRVFADPTVEKIVHAGEQDVEPVARLIGQTCTNLFDTQIAAGFVGLAYPVSLSKLVQAIAGAKLGKGMTFSHWDQRPLSGVQLRYAADDVRYLPAVRSAIGTLLDQLGHAGWAKEESEALCDPKRYEFDPDSDFLRVRGAGALSASGLAVLRALMIWRDAMARQANVPPRAYLRDNILLDMARHPPKAVEKLDRIRGLPRPVEQQHGNELVQLTLRALEEPLRGIAADPQEPTPAERFRADSLWAVVQSLCLGQSFDPNIVASRQDIAELDRALARGADVSHHRLMQGWRGEAIGGRLMQIIRDGKAFSMRWAGERIQLSADA